MSTLGPGARAAIAEEKAVVRRSELPAPLQFLEHEQAPAQTAYSASLYAARSRYAHPRYVPRDTQLLLGKLIFTGLESDPHGCAVTRFVDPLVFAKGQTNLIPPRFESVVPPPLWEGFQA